MKQRQETEYLERVFDSSPVPLISLDMRFRVIMFNAAACRLTGYSPGDVAGRRVTAILPLRRIKMITRTLRNSGTWSMDGYMTRLVAKDGREIPVRLKATSLMDSEGRLFGFLLVASDLGEIREVHSKMLEAERLAAITETAISINHEINNPLCSILGNTQLMLMDKGNLSPDMIRKLETIEKQTARIQEIAERLGKITRPVLKEYVGGKKMLDVEHSGIKNPS